MSLRYGILGLLSHAPMTGYKLKKLFDKTLNNVWTASLSQIYRELVTLEKDNLVIPKVQAQDDKPDKKVYTITQSGKESFQNWLMQSPEAFISPKRDEFMLRLFFCSSMGVSHVKEQLALFSKDIMQAVEKLEREALKFHELKANFIGSPDDGNEEEKYIRFIIKRAQLTNRLLMNWAQDCIRELEEPQRVCQGERETGE